MHDVGLIIVLLVCSDGVGVPLIKLESYFSDIFASLFFYLYSESFSYRYAASQCSLSLAVFFVVKIE